MEFIDRLVSLVPRPRMNLRERLVQFHGIFSRGSHPPNSKLREKIAPEKLVEVEVGCSPVECKPSLKRYGMFWAQRLKRVFNIEIEECEKCGGNMKVIASIEEPDVIEKILKHLGLNKDIEPHNRSPPTQSSGLFDQAITLI